MQRGWDESLHADAAKRHFGTMFLQRISAIDSESLKNMHTLDTLIALLEIYSKEIIRNANLGTKVRVISEAKILAATKMPQNAERE